MAPSKALHHALMIALAYWMVAAIISVVKEKEKGWWWHQWLPCIFLSYLQREMSVVSLVVRVGGENAREEEQQLVISIKADKLDSLLQQKQEIELVNHLKEMDSSIQVLEEDLETVFRQLIKTRVSLLNH